MEAEPVEEVNGSSGRMTGLGYDSSQWPAFSEEEVTSHEDVLDNGAHLWNSKTSVESKVFNIEFDRNKFILFD